MNSRRDRLEKHVVSTLIQLENDGLINGLGTAARRNSLAKQIVESHRRIEYVQVLNRRDISSIRCDPVDERFDPLKAAIAFKRDGDIDESCWMVFYYVHFGKNSRGGWRYARDVYGALGHRERWTWANVSKDPQDFRRWLGANEENIKHARSPGGFGNHRKYQSLSADADDQTGAAFESYVEWIGEGNSHVGRFSEITSECENSRGERFDAIYCSMSAVKSFGRMARFDYLCMIGKLEIFDIEPTSVYVGAATGPKTGGKLLFGGSPTARRTNAQLEAAYKTMAQRLGLPFGMQVIEDAVCNWQKSPDEFRAFRG